MKRIALVVALIFASIAPAHAGNQNLVVMSRNLYLGADVGVALEKLPNFSQAAQFMWSQVAATDFPRRAPVLAAEVIAQDADVVGLQEATKWYCKKNAWSRGTVVFDFTREFLDATKRLGHEYVLASREGIDALNTGYSIPAIPFLTMVSDPHIFQPLFGQDKAACGFEIADALVLKKELADSIIRVGNSEFKTSYSIIPTLMTIYRGYTWMDLRFAGSQVRIVSTHLESLWDKNKVPNALFQTSQLISDLEKTSAPTIVIGDFNSDPRDPRPVNGANPGEQPVASANCPVQVKFPTKESALDSCNAYWKMVKSGYTDVGPDSQDPANYTWGMSALLAGPDLKRLPAALEMRNMYGFTDRLDYIFTKNGIQTLSAKIVGNTWPNGSTWQCLNEEQVTNTHRVAKALNIAEPTSGTCNATDHASVVANLLIPADVALGENSPPPAHSPFPISFWDWVGIAFLVVIGVLIYRRLRRAKGRVEEE